MIKVSRFILFVVFTSSCFFISNLKGAELSAKDIMQKQNDLHSAKFEIEKQQMLLIDRKGKKETRILKRYSKEVEKGVFKYLLVFLKPTDVEGVALLTWQHKGKSEDQWIYMPALGKKLKRIASGSKKGYFMGTDFTYEDLSADKIDDYSYKIIKEEKLNNDDCYVIEAVASNPETKKETGYSKKIYWIRKDIFFAVKIEYYDKRNRHSKTQQMFEIEKTEGTRYRAKKAIMEHLKKKHKTLVLVAKRKIDSEIKDSIFTERTILKGEQLHLNDL